MTTKRHRKTTKKHKTTTKKHKIDTKLPLKDTKPQKDYHYDYKTMQNNKKRQDHHKVCVSSQSSHMKVLTLRYSVIFYVLMFMLKDQY